MQTKTASYHLNLPNCSPSTSRGHHRHFHFEFWQQSCCLIIDFPCELWKDLIRKLGIPGNLPKGDAGVRYQNQSYDHQVGANHEASTNAISTVTRLLLYLDVVTMVIDYWGCTNHSYDSRRLIRGKCLLLDTSNC